MDKWLGRLEASGWLTNVSSVLNCAALIAQSLVQVSHSKLFVSHLKTLMKALLMDMLIYSERYVFI